MNKCDADHEPMGDADVALMLAFQDGDEEAFVKLYRQYRNKVFNFTRRLLGNAASGEEATQEVFLKLYRARHSYKPKSRLSTFIFRIATNHCLNMMARHEHKLKNGDVDVEQRADAGQSPESDAERLRLRQAIQHAVATLPDHQRVALLLCLHEGMSYREVSDVLRVSTSAVKSLVFRARENMVEKLKPYRKDEVSHAVS